MHDITPGDILEGRYEIKRFLGQGGFAHVWQAVDQQLGRQVAIKILHVQQMALADHMLDVVLKRFEREAKLAASLHHPNVVQIHDIGHLRGDRARPFIVMELLDGLDLHVHIDRSGACDPAHFLARFIDCLDGLDRAHQRGIVHKDLKPSNIFLSDPGKRTEALKLVDFGIAHMHQPSVEGAGRLTSTGQLLGTPQYLPPEYIHGQTVSPAMDVYQMSLILIEALSAEYMLGDESSLQCLIIHGDGRLEAPTYLLDSPLGPILRKGLERDPKARYQRAGELADALSTLDASTLPGRPLMPPGEALPRQRLDGKSSPSPIERDRSMAGHAPGRPAATPHRVDTDEAYMPTEAHGMTPPRSTSSPQDGGHAPLSSPHHVEPSHSAPYPSQHAGPTPRPDARKQETITHQRPIMRGARGCGYAFVIVMALFGMSVCGFCAFAVMFEDEIAEFNEDSEREELEERALDEQDLTRDQIDQMTKEPTKRSDADALKEAVKSGLTEANALLDEGDSDTAVTLCEDLLREVSGRSDFGVEDCYNIILRAHFNPTLPFGERATRGCKMLGRYERAYPKHAMAIRVQRDILACIEHDL